MQYSICPEKSVTGNCSGGGSGIVKTSRELKEKVNDACTPVTKLTSFQEAIHFQMLYLCTCFSSLIFYTIPFSIFHK